MYLWKRCMAWFRQVTLSKAAREQVRLEKERIEWNARVDAANQAKRERQAARKQERKRKGR